VGPGAARPQLDIVPDREMKGLSAKCPQSQTHSEKVSLLLGTQPLRIMEAWSCHFCGLGKACVRMKPANGKRTEVERLSPGEVTRAELNLAKASTFVSLA
jgi:hypothetical protein